MSTTPHVGRFERDYWLPSSAASAFGALTEAVQLKAWFAESVEVEPRAGGHYRFWGRYTPWMLDSSLATQKISRWEPVDALGFSWKWRDCDTSVLLTLVPEGSRTKLNVAHSWSGELWPVAELECDLLGDFWGLAAANLASFLRNGAPLLRPDYAERADDVHLSIDVAAPPERVFQALTDPAQMDQWLSKQATVELRPGGKYSFGWGEIAGVPNGPQALLAVESNRLVVHDWFYDTEPRTTVRWELMPIPGGTRITVHHERVGTFGTRGAYIQGWAKFLTALHRYAQRP